MPDNYFARYLPLLIHFLLAGALATALVTLSWIIGYRRPTRAKLSPYECGMTPVGDARQRFSVKFYMVAVLFIIFDIETVFMIPWAVYFRQLSCFVPLVNDACPVGNISFFGLGEMLVFMLILFVGLVYVWKKGALQWD